MNVPPDDPNHALPSPWIRSLAWQFTSQTWRMSPRVISLISSHGCQNSSHMRANHRHFYILKNRPTTNSINEVLDPYF